MDSIVKVASLRKLILKHKGESLLAHQQVPHPLHISPYFTGLASQCPNLLHNLWHTRHRHICPFNCLVEEEALGIQVEDMILKVLRYVSITKTSWRN